MSADKRIGVYPGTFDPLTIAHLAISEAACVRMELDRLDLAISRDALGKDHLDDSTIGPRIEAIARAGAARPWLGAVVTDAVLVADIAAGYDVVVMGADKWAQVNDPRWYGGDEAARDLAVQRLPEVAVAPRGGLPVAAAILLDLPDHLGGVSSTAVREGRHDWSAHPPD